jgi:hypothetical protein
MGAERREGPTSPNAVLYDTLSRPLLGPFLERIFTAHRRIGVHI